MESWHQRKKTGGRNCDRPGGEGKATAYAFFLASDLASVEADFVCDLLVGFFFEGWLPFDIWNAPFCRVRGTE